MPIQKITSTDITNISNTSISGTITGSQISANTVTSTNLQTGSVENYMSSQGLALGMRNRIINGDMRIDQRNAGGSVTPTSGGTFTLDRWSFALSQSSKFSVQQNAGAVTPPSGFSNYIGVTSLSSYTPLAADYFAVQQKIEGLNCADLDWGKSNAKTVTISFWVRSSLTGTFGGSVNSTSWSRSYPFSYIISSANTWEYKTITISGDTTGTWLVNNGIGVYVQLALGYGSTYGSGTAGAWVAGDVESVTGAVNVLGTNGATFYITGVQLEKGATATPFENRLYGTELALCQRYYYKAISGTLFNQLAFCNIRTTTSHYALLPIPVTMRANPSSVDYSALGIIASWGAGVTGLTSLSFANAAYGASTTQVLLDAVTTGAVGTVGQISMLLANNNASAYVALNAEL